MKIVRPKSKQPIPRNAKRVFKGVVFDVYHWKQKMFDGGYQTFEKIKREDTVMVIPVTEEGKIILLKEEQPGKKSFLAAVGGRVGRNEPILKAAKRELLEETGYKAKEFVLFDVVQPVSKIEWVVYTFIAKGCKKFADISPDSGEKIELMFVSFEEFLETVFSGKFQDTEMTLKLMQEGYAKVIWDEPKVEKLKKRFLTSFR